MRVTNTFNNSLNETTKSSASRGSTEPSTNKTSEFGPRREKAQIPGQENLSRAEILQRVERLKNPPKEMEAAASVDIESVAKPAKNERPAQLVKPLWDDAGEEDPAPQKTAQKALERAQELTGAKPQAQAQEVKEDVEKKGDTIKIVEEVKSDVGVNRPDDPETKNKLKHALTTGAFQFSAKEKEVLQGILGDQ